MNEGYIKFTVHLADGDLPPCAERVRLNEVRTELHDLGLIGVLPGGIGFGNVSVRLGDSGKFIISGTATGARRILRPEDYCCVDSFDPSRNEVHCTGRIRASSESMSHGAVYQADRQIHCVIHVHSRELFQFMLAEPYPRTPQQAAFGTPELAEEILRLVRAGGAAQGIFVTAGHEDGVIAYGPDADAVRNILLDTLRRFNGATRTRS